MYFAKLENGQIVKSHINLSDEVPVGILPENPTAEQLAAYGVVMVHAPDTLPEHNEETHGLVDADPVLGGDGKWYASYTVIEKAPEPEVPELPQP